jgi:hypothetical protein
VHSAEFKMQVLAECQQSGASVAAVALAHGLNVNLLRKWLVGRGIKRAGADRLLTVVVNTLGEARAHHGYLFANARASRLKLLVHDGFGVWCATRRLHAGRFVWHMPEAGSAAPALQLSTQQFEALALGLPWQRLGELSPIRRC